MAAQLSPSDPAYHMDWIFGASNVHYANHKGWFTKFTPFDSTCGNGVGSIKVKGWSGPSSTTTDATISHHIGVGTVTLRVKKRDSKRGRRDTTILILEDVLYTPDSLCNLVSGGVMDQYYYKFGNEQGKDGFYDKTTGGRVAILDHPKPLWRLRLTGQSATESILDKNGNYCFFTYWSDSERVRWQELKTINLKQPRDQSSIALGSSSQSQVGRTGLVRASEAVKFGNIQYSHAERKWLKKNYGGEYKFLRDYGFNIYDEEDRADGHRLLQGIMEDGQNENEKAEPQEKFPKVSVESVSNAGTDED